MPARDDDVEEGWNRFVGAERGKEAGARRRVEEGWNRFVAEQSGELA